VSAVPRRASVAFVVAVSVGFAVLAHVTIVEGRTSGIGALLSLVPLALVAAWAARHARRPLVVAALALAAAIAWIGWAELERHFPDVFFLEHAGANLALAIVFGRTLTPGREPLCTRFARLLHGTLPPAVEAYSRQVTLAWTIFFAAMFAASCLLYFGGWLALWSLLANFLSPALIAAMFAVEYFVRHRVLPGWERVGVLGGIRAFARHFG
jgi:uncharacterized membrane protein